MRRAGNTPIAGRLVLASLLLALVALLVGTRPHTPPALLIEAPDPRLPANGFSSTELKVRSSDGRPLTAVQVQLQVREGTRRAEVESVLSENGALRVGLRAGVLPGPAVVEARARGFAPARVEIETELDASDRAGDGTPDFLRFDHEADRQAFRRWFTFLAETEYYRAPGERPAEIQDCAALIRFAYREALRQHTGAWASALELPALPAIPPVRKYEYPYTALGAGLFRVKPGRFRAADVANGAFAQFADAATLMRRNTHLVTRDLRRALPGDLLFFRQLEQRQPFHSMIFLGHSQYEDDGRPWLLYHTGPLGGGLGEIRRVTVEELIHHPSARWHPVPGNENFLGVYRWNILRRDE